MIRKIVFVVLGLLFTFSSCQKKPSVPIVAKVGKGQITVREFKQTFAFNPYLSRIRDADSAKKVLLRTMIAEKMLAQEARAARTDHQQKKLKALLEQYKREALIEAFWKSVIAPQVKITEAELKKAYFKSKIKKIVQYLLFTDEEEAEEAYQQLQSGLSFETLALRRGFTAKTIPVDTISFKGVLPNIEEHVFQMKVGALSPPLREGYYYFIVKVVGEQRDIFTAEDDFRAHEQSLRKILKRRKMQQTFQEYLKKHLPNPPYQLHKKRFKALARLIEKQAFANKDWQNKEEPSAEIFNSLLPKEDPVLEQAVVQFANGESWSGRTLIQRLSVAPYPLRFENKKIFIESFLLAARRVMDDQLVVDQALKHGLENSAEVYEQVHLWQDYLYFKRGLALALKGKELTDQKAVYDFLNRIKDKYPVTVYYNVLDTLKLEKTDMAVLKQHFPGRIAVPVYPLLPGFKWNSL